MTKIATLRTCQVIRDMKQVELKAVIRMLYQILDSTGRSIAKKNLRACLTKRQNVCLQRGAVSAACLADENGCTYWHLHY